MTATANLELRQRVERLRSLPSSPALLKPLLELLHQPPDKISLDKLTQLVSYEETISAQLLRIANSPLYGRARPAESIQAAIVTLGIQRIEDILLSSCIGKLVPADKWVVDLDIFWRHSFGCAMVCREFADRIGYAEPEKAYLAGLLHDIGIIVNSLAYTEEYRATVAAAASAGRPLVEQEQEISRLHALRQRRNSSQVLETPRCHRRSHRMAPRCSQRPAEQSCNRHNPFVRPALPPPRPRLRLRRVARHRPHRRPRLDGPRQPLPSPRYHRPSPPHA